MAYRKCPACGAPLKGGTDFCEYCNTDWSPAPPIAPGRAVPQVPMGQPVYEGKPAAARKNQVLIFLVLLLFCAPAALIYMFIALPWPKRTKAIVSLILLLPLIAILIFGYFYETDYAVRMNAPKYGATPIPMEKRNPEKIQPEDIYAEMRGVDGRSLKERKAAWREKFEGRWVEWEGTVVSTEIYAGSACSLHLKTSPGAPFEVEAIVDPLKKSALETLDEGDRVLVSGRLWGYYFIGDTIRLGDSMVIKGLGAGNQGAAPATK